jgi:hypothetical protein
MVGRIDRWLVDMWKNNHSATKDIDNVEEWHVLSDDESLFIAEESGDIGSVRVLQAGIDERTSDLYAAEVAFVEDVDADEFLLLMRDVYGGVRGVGIDRDNVQREKLIGQLRAAALYECGNVVRQCITALLDDSVGGVMLTPINSPFVLRMALELRLPRLALYCQDMILSDWTTLLETDFAGLNEQDKALLMARRDDEHIDTTLDDERDGANGSGGSGSVKQRVAASLSTRLASARAAGGRFRGVVKDRVAKKNK